MSLGGITNIFGGFSHYGAVNTKNIPHDSTKSSGKGELDPNKSAEKASEKKKAEDPQTLSKDEEDQVKELKQTDQRVRTHENAHMAAAGDLARGGPNYELQRGPDGKNYAVGGNVQIDTSPGRTAKETILKSQRIRAAALAPADPSPQDMKVAAQAGQMEVEARAKIQKGEGEDEKAAQKASDEKSLQRAGLGRVFSNSPEANRDQESGNPRNESGSRRFANMIATAYSRSSSIKESEFSSPA